MSNAMKLAFLIVLAGIAYACHDYYSFYTMEKVTMEDSYSEQEAALTGKQRELNDLKNFAQNIDSIKQELRELNSQLETALEYMPRNYNLSGLLRKLTLLAQNSGLELSTFKPAIGDERKDGTFYSTVPLAITLRGSFTQSLVFFDQVSRLKRIISIEDINMNLEQNSSSRIGAAVLNTEARLRIYRFSE